MLNETDDLSRTLLAKAETSSTTNDVQEMEQFMTRARQGNVQTVATPGVQPSGDPGRPLPVEPPQRRKTDDPMGRLPVPEDKKSSAVSRNVAEIPGAAVAGVESAIKNAMGWAIDPMANWLNENIADLSYDRKAPQTPTGNVTKSVVEFLTGFVPALKGLRAVGMTGKVAAPMAAGAFADFAARDPSSGRLADLWKQLNLPPNVLTDYLASKPEDSAMEARFKNALEGAGLGLAVEGILLGARVIRSAKHVKGAKQTETAYLKDKYGEIDDATFNKIIGDPSKPSVEMVVHKPGPQAAKIAQGAEDTKNLAPRSVIRMKVASKTGGKTAGEAVKPSNQEFTNPEIESNLEWIREAQERLESKVIRAQEAGRDASKEEIRYNAHEFLATILENHQKAIDNPKLLENSVFRYTMDEGAPVAGIQVKILPNNEAEIMWVASLVKGEGRKLMESVFRELEDVGVSKVKGVAKAGSAKFHATTGAKITEIEGQDLGKVLHDSQNAEWTLKPKKTGAKPVEPEDFEVYVNFAKFDEPEQVKFAIGKMAEAAKGTIDEATRGTITHAETQKLADDLGMTVTDLLARRKGQPLNAEEAVAARQLWAASSERLVELAKVANSKAASPLDLFAFRKQMAVHAAIQAEVIGARTETARALSSWNIPVKGGIERARAVDQVMAAMGGPENAAEMARRLAILAETGANPAAIAKFVQQGATATTMDAVREAWINGLLSSPKTHVVNMMSNTMVTFASIAERQVAAGIRAMSGGEGVEMLEGAAMTYGLVSSIRDAFRMSAKALKTGESSWTFNKVDLPQVHAISSEAFGMSRETSVGRFVDTLGTGMRVPTRLLGAEDEFFKTIAYRAELHAQALRTAKQEGHTGYELGRRVAEIVQDPPEHVMINSADAALYRTFTNETGKFGSALLRARDNVPALTFILPFIRTPVNIARYAFEHSPFAPLVGQWRADIAAGGARADLALARMSTGTMVMLTAMDLADKGMITGEGHWGGKDTALTEAMQRQGWQPYSVKIGDRWYSYNRADPFGMTLGFAASIAEAVRKGEINADEVDEWQEVTAMSIAAVSQVAISKTYLEGFSNFIEAVSDPKRYSQKYVNDLLASFTPMVSMNAAVKNIVDPVQREAQSPREAVMAKIAGLSANLPPRRNLWGEEVRTESGLGKSWDFLSPIASKQIKESPIDREMVRLNHGMQRIAKNTNFDGVHANMRFYPKAYDDYVRLAGNDLKHPVWGVGAKDYLDAVVSGKHVMSEAYRILSDDARRDFIQSTIQDFRKLAQREVLANPAHAGFAAEVAQLKAYSQRSKMPVLGEQ
jgi:hypothetical protein